MRPAFAVAELAPTFSVFPPPQTSLSIVRDNLHKSVQTQRLLRNVEFRDRFVAERNYERVSFWSILTTVVMMATFLIQVVMIRSLFSNSKGKTTTKT